MRLLNFLIDVTVLWIAVYLVFSSCFVFITWDTQYIQASEWAAEARLVYFGTCCIAAVVYWVRSIQHEHTN